MKIGASGEITKRDWEALRRDLAGRAECALALPCSDDPLGCALLLRVCREMGHRGAPLRTAKTALADWAARTARSALENSDRDITALLFIRYYLPEVWSDCRDGSVAEFDASIGSLVSLDGSICDRPLCSAVAWANLRGETTHPALKRLQDYLSSLVRDPARLTNDRSAAVGIGLLLHAGEDWMADQLAPHLAGVLELLEQGSCSLRRELPLAYMLAQCRRYAPKSLRYRIRQACGNVLRSYLSEQYAPSLMDGDADGLADSPLSRLDLALAYALTAEYSDNVVTTSTGELECPIAVRVMAAISGLVLTTCGIVAVWLGWRWGFLRSVDWAGLRGAPWHDQIGAIAAVLASNAVVAGAASILWVAGGVLIVSTTVRGRSHHTELFADLRKWALLIVIAIVTSLVASLLIPIASGSR